MAVSYTHLDVYKRQICNIADIRDSVINEVERTGAEHAVFDLYGTLVDIHTDEEDVYKRQHLHLCAIWLISPRRT